MSEAWISCFQIAGYQLFGYLAQPYPQLFGYLAQPYPQLFGYLAQPYSQV